MKVRVTVTTEYADRPDEVESTDFPSWDAAFAFVFDQGRLEAERMIASGMQMPRFKSKNFTLAELQS